MTISKAGILDWAEWHPLGPETEPEIHPEVLIYHTMVGYLNGTENMFKQGGFDGTESTFGLGGPWDGPSLDGAMYQWQFTLREADAQFAGNVYANSCECSDGGHPTNPFSSKQLDALVRLTVDFCRATGAPAQLVPQTGPVGKGLGWHEWRSDWNQSHHVCPGAVREGQLRQIVIPKARAMLAGHAPPPAPKPRPVPAHHHGGRLAEDGILGVGTIGAMQHALNAHHYSTGGVDGVMGPATRAALQSYLKHLKLYSGAIDGVIGPVTTKALQHHVGVAQDGDWGKNTTRALQHALNNGRF